MSASADDRPSLTTPTRLGKALRRAREQAELGVDELAARDGFYRPDELAAIESGERPVGDSELRRLADLYGLLPEAFPLQRTELVIDLDEGTLASADHEVSVGGGTSTTEDVLASYLALVTRLRGGDVGAPVPLRQEDLDVLGRALELTGDQVRHRLEALVAGQPAAVDTQRERVRNRYLVPIIGVVVAATAAGVLLLVTRDDDPAPADSPGTTIVSTETTVGAVITPPSSITPTAAVVENTTTTG